MRQFIFLFFALFPMFLFGQQKEFHWLVGVWQEENKNSFEVWEPDGKALQANSYTINSEGKKIENEKIRLVKKGKDFFFVADVAGPQEPVEFKITSFSADQFVAENPAHDFPKKIMYVNKGESLVATISDDKQSITYLLRKRK